MRGKGRVNVFECLSAFERLTRNKFLVHDASVGLERGAEHKTRANREIEMT